MAFLSNSPNCNGNVHVRQSGSENESFVVSRSKYGKSLFCDRLFFFLCFIKSLVFSVDPGQRVEVVTLDEPLKIRSQIVKWQL